MRGAVAKRLRKACKERAEEYNTDWKKTYKYAKRVYKTKNR